MTRPSYKLKDHLEGKVVLIDWCTFKLSKLLQVKTNFADDVLPQYGRVLENKITFILRTFLLICRISSEWAVVWEEFDYHTLRDAGRPRERQFLTYNSSSYTIRERRSKTTSVRNSVIYSLKSEKRPLPSPTPKRSITLRNWSVRGAPYFSDRNIAEKQVTELGGLPPPLCRLLLKDNTGKNSSKITKNGILLKPKRVTGIVEHLPPFRTKLVK